MLQQFKLTFPEEVVAAGIVGVNPGTTGLSIAKVVPHISSAEERYLKPLLGLSLLDDLIAQRAGTASNYNSQPPVLKFPNNAAYELLWTKYLWQYAANAAFVQALPYIYYQIAEAGIFVNSTEYAKPAKQVGLDALIDDFQMRQAGLEESIKQHICRNPTDFPLFPNDNCDSCGCEDCDFTGYIYKLNKKLKCHCTSKGSRSNILFY